MSYYEKFMEGQSDFVGRLECHSPIELLAAYIYAKTGANDLQDIDTNIIEAFDQLEANINEINEFNQGNHASDN